MEGNCSFVILPEYVVEGNISCHVLYENMKRIF